LYYVQITIKNLEITA